MGKETGAKTGAVTFIFVVIAWFVVKCLRRVCSRCDENISQAASQANTASPCLTTPVTSENIQPGEIRNETSEIVSGAPQEPQNIQTPIGGIRQVFASILGRKTQPTKCSSIIQSRENLSSASPALADNTSYEKDARRQTAEATNIPKPKMPSIEESPPSGGAKPKSHSWYSPASKFKNFPSPRKSLKRISKRGRKELFVVDGTTVYELDSGESPAKTESAKPPEIPISRRILSTQIQDNQSNPFLTDSVLGMNSGIEPLTDSSQSASLSHSEVQNPLLATNTGIMTMSESESASQTDSGIQSQHVTKDETIQKPMPQYQNPLQTSNPFLT